MTIASLVVSVGVDQSGLTRHVPKIHTDLNTIGGAADQVTQKFDSLSGGMGITDRAAGVLQVSLGRLLAGFGAVQLIDRAIGALVGFAREAFAGAGQIVDLSNKTGLSTDALQRMEHVALQTGGTLEQFTNAAFRLGIRLSGRSDSVSAAVRALGLSLSDLNQMDAGAQLERTLGALGAIGDVQTRNRLGTVLYGTDFRTMAAAVTEGYDQIAAGAAMASEAQLRALDAAADAWTAWTAARGNDVQSFLGSLVLAARGVQQLSLTQNLVLLASGAGAAALIETYAALGTAAQQLQTDLVLAPDATTTNYIAQLAEVDRALGRLTHADRAQIEAALALGVSVDTLSTQYPVLAEHLGRYNALQSNATRLTREHDAAAEKLQRTLGELRAIEFSSPAIGDMGVFPAQAVNDAYWASVSTAQQTADTNALTRHHDTLVAMLAFEVEIGQKRGLNERDLFALTAQLEQAKLNAAVATASRRFALETQLMDHTSAAYQILKADHLALVDNLVVEWQRGEVLRRAEFTTSHEMFTAMLEQFGVTAADTWSAMLVGARGFKDGLLDIWRSLQRGIASILSQILQTYLRQFIAGVTSANSGLAQSLAGAFVSGYGGGTGSSGGGLVAQGASLVGGGAGGAGGYLGVGGPAYTGIGNQAGTTASVASYGTGALAGGVAGVSVGYQTQSKWKGALSGAGTGALTGFQYGGVYGALIGAGVGAIAGVVGAELGSQGLRERVAAARDEWVRQAGGDAVLGGYNMQLQLGIIGGDDPALARTNLGLWRQLYAADTFREFEAATKLVDRALRHAAVVAMTPPDLGPIIGTRFGEPIRSYATEGFNLIRPHLAIVGDANEPENVVKNSTLRRLAGGEELRAEIRGLRGDLQRQQRNFPRQIKIGISDALALRGLR